MSKGKRFHTVFFEIWQLLENWEPVDLERVSVTLTGGSGQTITIEKDRKSWLKSQKQPNCSAIKTVEH